MTAQPIDLRDATRHPNPGGDRDPARIDDVLDALRDYWRANPDLRLGQIVSNLATRDVDVFVVEDEFLIERLAAQTPTVAPVRYSIRSGVRGARRRHVYRDVLTEEGVFTGSSLCKGTDEQTFVQPRMDAWDADPFTHWLPQADVTCDRCWTAYDRLATASTADRRWPDGTGTGKDATPANPALGSTS